MSFEITLDDSASTTTNEANRVAANRTKHLKSAEHVFKRPGMYIGDVKRTKRKILILDEAGRSITRIDSDIPPGLERIIIEAIANVCDHTLYSRNKGCDPGVAMIEMGADFIKIINFGWPMPIVQDEFGEWIPTKSFGKLRTGTNFDDTNEDDDDEDKFGGCHGLGIKLANIFSDPTKGFHVRVVDQERHLCFTQSWAGGPDGLKTPQPPAIQPCYEGSSVMLMFYPNLRFFGYKDGKFPPEMYHLIRRHAADASFTAKTPFVFNGLAINYPTVLQYAQLSFPELNNGANFLIHYEWPPNTPVTKNKDGTQVANNGRYPRVEMIVIDAPSQGRTLGFANSIINPDGGIHVDTAIRAVTGRLVDKLNASLVGKKKKNDDDDSKGKEKKTVKITMRDVRPMFGLITANRVKKPFFPGQCKDKMPSCASEITIKIGEKALGQIDKWNLGFALQRILGTKRKNLLSASDGRKLRNVGKFSGTDANEAGGPNWRRCAAIGYEGKSAENYFTNLTGIHPGGRDFLGGLSFRGKVPNALKASIETIAENKEFTSLKTMLGLQEELDYTIPANQQTLRYGSFIIMTDADLDGWHIKGLILAWFYRFFPSLLQIGFVQDYRTPYLRAYKGEEVMPFFLEKQFEEWKNRTPDHEKWRYKYFKGLGSSEKADVIQDYACSNIVTMFVDQSAEQFILLAFGKETADYRKKWLASYNPHMNKEPIQNKVLPISKFFAEEFIQYGIYCLDRHLPGPDGLNLAMRKSIYGAMLTWSINFRNRGMKMAKFVGDVSNDTHYDHGDALGQVITRMCGDFVGFLNVPYFIGKGMSGSRDKGGKDAASVRYLGIEPNSWFLKRVFNPIDFKIMDKQNHNGSVIEPKFFLPIIPLHLVQGAAGIGFGWFSFWPAHNLIDVVDYLIARNNQDQVPNVVPAYRGFTGEIFVVDERKKVVKSALDIAINPDGTSDVEEEYEIPADPLYGTSTASDDTSDMIELESGNDDTSTLKTLSSKNSKRGGYNMVTRGVVNNMGFTGGTVVDLPIGLWIDTYRDYLIKLRTKKIIENYRDLSDESKIHFEVIGFNAKNANGQPRHVNLKDMGLERHFSLNNLVILDEYSRPMKFEKLEQAFDHFYNWRLPYYIKRQKTMLDEINAEIIDIDQRLAYMNALLNKSIRVTQKKTLEEKSAILERIVAAGFKPEYYGSVKLTANYHRKLIDRRVELIKEGERLSKMYPQQLWNEDLLDIRTAYIEKYGDDRRRQINSDEIDITF